MVKFAFGMAFPLQEPFFLFFASLESVKFLSKPQFYMLAVSTTTLLYLNVHFQPGSKWNDIYTYIHKMSNISHASNSQKKSYQIFKFW